MNAGTVIAVVLLAGYVGFEAYAIRSAGERMEPAYIHNLMLEAQVATELCESDALELRPRFEKTLNRVTGSHRKDTTLSNPDLTSEDIDALLRQQAQTIRTEVTQAIEATGCATRQARAHFQRYRIYARKTR